MENELKQKKAQLDAQNQVYDKIAAALDPKQKRIQALLEGAPPDSAALFPRMAPPRISKVPPVATSTPPPS